MANKFDKLQYDSEYYFPRDSVNDRINGTQSSKTSVWVGALPEGVDECFDGFTIDYFLPKDSDVSEVTLKLGTGDAKPVYFNNGVNALTPVTDQGKANTVIRLTYVVRSEINSGNGAWLVSDGMISGAGIALQKSSDTIKELSFENGSAPELTTSDAVTVSKITDWKAGTMFSAKYEGGILKVYSGTKPSLESDDSITITGVSSWNPGTMTVLAEESTKTFLTDVAVVEE